MKHRLLRYSACVSKHAPFAVCASIVILFCGCSKESESGNISENDASSQHEVAAELRIISTRQGPLIIATSRIPLDKSKPLRYFLVIDGNTLSTDYDDRLPIGPSASKIRFGNAWQHLPLEALDEKINLEAVEATEKGDIATLERIAKSLTGRVSFLYEYEEDAYGE